MLSQLGRKIPWVGFGFLIVGVVALGCASSGIVIEVDITKDIHPISEDIYGISTSTGALPHFEDMGISVVRWGGNARSRFNWEINSSNAGADWEYRNVRKGDEVPGSAAIEFHNSNASVGAKSLLTVPIIGWVAKDRHNATQSINVPDGIINGYEPDDNRVRTSLVSYARKDGAFEYPPNVEDEAVYQDEWVHYLSQTIGNAASGGIQYYEMGNEPMLWISTHRDVRPNPVSYDDYLETFVQYANAVKDVDPTAQVFGPAAWGWMSYFYSAMDEGADNFGTASDRTAHSGKPFLPWFLGKVKESDDASGRRSLDALSIHYYPENGAFSNDTSPEIQALRLRSTRSLWDSTYEEESWIARTDEGPVVRLIPLMREWIDANYPGTKLAVTEWDWGAKEHISGGLATADVLGIFGKEGVDLATYWGVPDEGTPTYWAFRMFRNYDGQGGKFGNVSVKADSNQPDTVTAYASVSIGTNEIKVVLINKSPLPSGMRLNLNGTTPNSDVSVHQYGQNTPDGIVRLPSIKLNDNSLTYMLPPYSMTMLVAETQTS